jgi:hypothetical protein
MSFVILQAVMKRLEERSKTRLFADLGSTMKLPRSGHGRLGLEVIELADHERPPMIRIPEYLEKRRNEGAAAVAGAVAQTREPGTTGAGPDGLAPDGERPASGAERPASGAERPASGAERPASGAERPAGPR